ncbi:UPF0053 inner membrane protein YoaE [Candidatus Erwinia haradaeae]|uniref:UPF0053 inner membrane protein YoaE n=1 Tax=Candidatus Erwinia haradaeae TaxID=1922217 RepID=A0A451DJ34_9GAMM|nr:TerC family protein [Candidatus Erwinia haradaeae]VFP86728.1 UPF0053 inner membrane protein YoaE [Candidatus Erwinia haradaeae]
MSFLLDPSVLAGFFTLVLLEIVLGIDNLVFIAILSDKLSPKQRDKARLTGLLLAMVMRLGLLSLMSWMSTMSHPLFSIGDLSFSGRELMLLTGGVFLLFKATTELHERLENRDVHNVKHKGYASFWSVVVQVVVLDAVFSLDAVITAVGMVNDLSIMMLAVVIAMSVMLIASKPLTNFVNAHPTVVVLCLSFLLMIGLSLLAEGFHFNIPKGYLYAAISFSIIIELFNQMARRNLMRYQERRPMRERTAEAIQRLMGGYRQYVSHGIEDGSVTTVSPKEEFKDEERYMMNGVLTLAARSVRSIMTPRGEISWVDLTSSLDEVRMQLLDTPHSLFPVCRGDLDSIIGVVRAKELLVALDHGVDVFTFASATPPIIIPDTLNPLNLLGVLRRAKGSFVVVTGEFGTVQGLITPLDVLEAIAGEFPDEDETPDIVIDEEGWLVKGGADLHSLQHLFNNQNLIKPEDHNASLAGLIIEHIGRLPKIGDIINIYSLRFQIIEATDYRIDLIRVTKQDNTRDHV